MDENELTTTRTHARVKANRRNARRSTGPKTPTGKAASSRNGMHHGLSCETGASEGAA